MRVAVPFRTPREWPRTPAKFLFRRVLREPRDEDGIVTAFRDGVVTLRSNRRVEGFTNALQEIGYQGLRRGDLVIHSMDGFAGAIGVSDADGKASPVVHAYVATSGADARYYAYLLRTLALTGFITSLGKGIRERSTAFDSETFRALALPSPPTVRQRQIANYLDAETARIDALVSRRYQMIDLVAERWSVELSDALGAEGGLRLKRLLAAPLAYGVLVPRHGSDDGVPMLRIMDLAGGSVDLTSVARIPAEQSDEYRRTQVRSGDLVVSVVGTLGRSIEITPELEGCNLNRPLARVQLHANVPRNLIRLWFESGRFREQARLATSSDSAQPTLGLGDLKNFVVGLPTNIRNWEALASHLQERHTVVARTKEMLGQQISLLREHRLALITAAVMGELEVSEMAA
jgi:type I restriction enzyme S subunit